jgi:hypothetical protein
MKYAKRMSNFKVNNGELNWFESLLATINAKIFELAKLDSKPDHHKK